jgi:hypothetical protein
VPDRTEAGFLRIDWFFDFKIPFTALTDRPIDISANADKAKTRRLWDRQRRKKEVYLKQKRADLNQSLS